MGDKAGDKVDDKNVDLFLFCNEYLSGIDLFEIALLHNIFQTGNGYKGYMDDFSMI